MGRALRSSGGLCLVIVLASVARAGPDEIQQAIARGVTFLKNSQSGDGTWTFMGPRNDGSHMIGVSSLAGLALLECDVAPDDPVIQKAAQVVRYGIIDTYETYDLSLAVMFLDRLRDAEDEGLIAAAAARLLAGQNASGGWGYNCPRVTSEPELRRLRTLVQKKDGKQRDYAEPEPARPAGIPEPPAPPRVGRGPVDDDNSNTQFATLALWIARRHQIRVERALSAVEVRFRRTQNPDGGWGYWPSSGAGGRGMGASTASMTTAGLLGLAVGYGVDPVLRTAETSKPSSSPPKDKRAADPNRDPTIQHGLRFLAKVIEPAIHATEAGGRFRGAGGRGQHSDILGNFLSSEYYFLWGVERVAMLYGLKMIDKKDWFAIGARFILQNQRNDGAWQANLGDTVDTCFALFFLRRVNLAGDLTATLRSKMKDSQVSLRAQDRPAEPVESDKRAGPEPAPVPANSGAPPAAASKKAEVSGEKPTSPTVGAPAPSASANVGRDPQAQEVAKLRDNLLHASPREQASLLQQHRDGKGASHTEVLASAIPLLNGTARNNARDALAERMARMNLATLRDKLQDENSEIRRASALACAMKGEKESVPDLIHLLEDSEVKVSRAAYAALKRLTHQDFGPAESADQEERTRAIARWREWQAKEAKNR